MCIGRLVRSTGALAALLLLGAARSASAQTPTPPQRATAPSDSAAVAAVVGAYHRALASGDTTGALALLAPDAVVLESGGSESRAEYRSHHLQADADFARAVRDERGPLRVTVRGDVAWVASTSTARGTFRGRAVNSAGAELMVLSREPGGWLIRAIHWSSRARRPTTPPSQSK